MADVVSFDRAFGFEGLQSHQSGEGREHCRTTGVSRFLHAVLQCLWVCRWEPSHGPAATA